MSESIKRKPCKFCGKYPSLIGFGWPVPRAYELICDLLCTRQRFRVKNGILKQMFKFDAIKKIEQLWEEKNA